jgi:hypothetical protein
LLGDDVGDRIEAGAGTAGEDDALHCTALPRWA